MGEDMTQIANDEAYDEVIFIPGDDEAFRGQCCITDRENPWHAWLRAEDHCFHFHQFTWHVRLETALACRQMAEAAMKQPLPPQRTVPIQWGWGNFPHLGIDKRRPTL
jgi:hypothetical protein